MMNITEMEMLIKSHEENQTTDCLLYTSDAADE